MMAAAQRAPIRRWFFAAYIAMRSAELGVHCTAIRCAMGDAGFVRARLWVRATRLDPYREPSALRLDNQPQPYAPCVFEKDDQTGFIRWVGPRHGLVRRTHPMWAAAALPSATRLSEQASPAVHARITSFCCDLTIELRGGIGSVHLTVEILTRSARRQYGQRKRGISKVVVLRQLYRQWLASSSN